MEIFLLPKQIYLQVQRQEHYKLDGGKNPGALKLTIRKFYLPEGASTQLKGVVPDVVLPSALTVLKIGEANMPESLPWDEVPSAPHAQLNRTAPYLPVLREKSATRIAADQEFQWLREDIDRARKQHDNPVISLNEQERRQETAEQQGRDKAHRKIRSQRPAIAEKQYEITLKNVGDAGLPPAATNAVVAASVTEDDDSASAPAPDFILDEGKRILADYLQLAAPRSAAAR